MCLRGWYSLVDPPLPSIKPWRQHRNQQVLQHKELSQIRHFQPLNRAAAFYECAHVGAGLKAKCVADVPHEIIIPAISEVILHDPKAQTVRYAPG